MSLNDGIFDLGDKAVLSEMDQSTIIFDQVQDFVIDGNAGLGIIEFFTMGGCHRYPQVWAAMR